MFAEDCGLFGIRYVMGELESVVGLIVRLECRWRLMTLRFSRGYTRTGVITRPFRPLSDRLIWVGHEIVASTTSRHL